MLVVRDRRVDDKDHPLYLLDAKFLKNISIAILLNVYGNNLYSAYFVLKKGRILLYCEMLLTAGKSEMHWEFCKVALGNVWLNWQTRAQMLQ